MSTATTNEVAFDILLKGRSGESSETPHVETIEQFKPAPEQIENVRRWLAGEGIVCHVTDFGLAGTAPTELFEKLFQVTLERAIVLHGEAPYKMTGEPVAPEPIAELIDQITLTVAPELF